jgi:hypothetical protein
LRDRASIQSQGLIAAGSVREYRVEGTLGGIMSADQNRHPAHDHVPAPDEPSIPELEEDETVAPRPEEEIADRLRAEPDVADHSVHRD